MSGERNKVVLKVEFTCEKAAAKYAAAARAEGRDVRHVELSTEHPYRGEVDRLFLELKERGVLPKASEERAKNHILERDEAYVVFKDGDGAEATLCFILGNEPGIALCDWSCKHNTPLWEKLEQVSRTVEEWYE